MAGQSKLHLAKVRRFGRSVWVHLARFIWLRHFVMVDAATGTVEHDNANGRGRHLRSREDGVGWITERLSDGFLLTVLYHVS